MRTQAGEVKGNIRGGVERRTVVLHGDAVVLPAAPNLQVMIVREVRKSRLSNVTR